MNKEIILVGGFHEIIELCEEIGYKIIGIIDNNLKETYWGYPIIGTDDMIKNLTRKYKNIPLVITPDLTSTRKKLFLEYSKYGFEFETIISPMARISKSSIIGAGAIIQHQVNVSSNVRIGIFAKLNVGCNIMHDSTIGNFVTIAPNAVILGRVNIGDSTYIGANSTILPGKSIGENVIVGAGAVVTKHFDSNSIIKGIPAK
jgi:sugar O-acyltransferase (sialic acid O-acetyltransferase NeuD family)